MQQKMSIHLTVAEPTEGIQVLDFEVQRSLPEDSSTKTVWDYFPSAVDRREETGPSVTTTAE